jgi:hypothetical protein
MFRTFETAGLSTVEITFSGFIPRRFVIYNSRGDIYFFRDLTENNRTIKVNIKHSDIYTTNADAFYSVGPFEQTFVNSDIPDFEKFFYSGKFKFRFNPNLKGTPARHFYKKNIIETGPNFYKYPFPIRVFILCHEVAHCFYSDEMKADTFACLLYIKNGYNKSMALHSLTDVLNMKSTQNRERVNNLIKILK